MARPKKKGPLKDSTLSFKVTSEYDDRLDGAAELTGLTRSDLVIAAVDAVLLAIERDRGIVYPVHFAVARIPCDAPLALYPASQHTKAGPEAEDMIAQEKSRRHSSSRARRDASQAPTGRTAPATER